MPNSWTPVSPHGGGTGWLLRSRPVYPPSVLRSSCASIGQGNTDGGLCMMISVEILTSALMAPSAVRQRPGPLADLSHFRSSLSSLSKVPFRLKPEFLLYHTRCELGTYVDHQTRFTPLFASREPSPRNSHTASHGSPWPFTIADGVPAGSSNDRRRPLATLFFSPNGGDRHMVRPNSAIRDGVNELALAILFPLLHLRTRNVDFPPSF